MKQLKEYEPRPMTSVRIYKVQSEAIEEFLKTDVAKRMGYIYKVDVVTDALRKFLEKNFSATLRDSKT